MNELTKRFQKYRECLRCVWNHFFAEDGDWDTRVHFSNAALELFRAMVLFDFSDSSQELYPSYRGEQGPIQSIRVRASPPWDKVRVSAEGTFREARSLLPDEDLSSVELAYVDLWDVYPLGYREFNYVCAEVLTGDSRLKSGTRVLIPFEHAQFERVE
jgi:hypothetical protein